MPYLVACRYAKLHKFHFFDKSVSFAEICCYIRLVFNVKKMFNSKSFGNEFVWGAAAASYQTEGAWNIDGKGLSVWDVFSHTKGKIKTGENGDMATDFYHRFREDITILRDLGLKAFRFSISWPRVMPQGTGEVNRQGLDFYHSVIDTCIELGVEPWITLYHWDLPQKLEEQGGWTNRKVLDWFENYVDIVTREYAAKVRNWMVLNEPMVFTGFGYMTGIHAPGRKGLGSFLPAVHHATLAQAVGARIIRKNVDNVQIGTTYSCSYVEPVGSGKFHAAAAKRIDALHNRIFVEPVLGLGYPTDALPFLKKLKKYQLSGDDKLAQFDFDFVGIQTYFRTIAKFALIPYLWANEVPANKRGVPHNLMNGEVYPEGIYHMLKKFGAYKHIRKIYVTENGTCVPDKVENGRVHDELRVKYFQDYLLQVLRAKNEGVPVEGYFAWSLTDNFEWAEGYRTRFGLVYVDFDTQQRILKDSALWFQEFLNK